MLEILQKAYELIGPVELFQLPQAGIVSRTVGVRTARGEFVWKFYLAHSNPESIRYEHRLLTWLTRAGLTFAVPAPVCNRDGETLTHAGQDWSALFPRLSGRAPDRRDASQIEQVGAALGELHRVLREYPIEPRPAMFGYGELAKHHARIPDPFQLAPAQLGLPERAPYADLLSWWRAELADLRAFADGPYRRLPLQVIHGDYDPAQTLFTAGRLSGVLDFEFALPDARAMDVATGLEFSIRIREPEGALERARAFCRGYARYSQLGPDEISAIPNLMRLRDATAAIVWFGRALAEGGVEQQLGRIQGMQQLRAWLARERAGFEQIMGWELRAG